MRDTLLKKQGISVGLEVDRPNSEQMTKYQADQTAKVLASGDHGISPLASQALQGLAKSAPDYRRNRAKICSFFTKGTCNRGDSCPFRHEKSDHTDVLLGAQNMRDRYYGTADPLAKKILDRVNDSKNAQTTGPEVSTVWVSGVAPEKNITEQDLKDHFYAFGEIIKIRLVAASKCAFVEYASHEQALNAIESLRNNLVIRGTFLKVAWAKPQANRNDRGYASLDAHQPRNTAPPPPGFVPYDPIGPGAPPPGAAGPLGWAPMYYPSMNPQRMGTSDSGAAASKDSHHNHHQHGPNTRSTRRSSTAQVEEPEDLVAPAPSSSSSSVKVVEVSSPQDDDLPAGGRVKRSSVTDTDPRKTKRSKA